MRDLKSIRFFERLLESADNELVRAEKEAGGVAVGYTCYYVPEALMNCSSAFSVRLRAPNTGSLDISQYYMSSFICGYTRALFERAFEGGMNFLDFYASSDTCQQMVRVVENIRELQADRQPTLRPGSTASSSTRPSAASRRRSKTTGRSTPCCESRWPRESAPRRSATAPSSGTPRPTTTPTSTTGCWTAGASIPYVR